MSLPSLLLVYIVSEYINSRLVLRGVNDYAKYLYVAMLTQHIVINETMRVMPYQSFSKFGYGFCFIFILVLTVGIAKFIVNFSKNIENKIIKLTLPEIGQNHV